MATTTDVLYEGEYVQIVASASFKDVPLVDTDIDSATVTIWQLVPEPAVEALAETDMAWDAAAGQWTFDWDTPPGAATYRFRVKLVGPGAHESWEYGKFKTKTDLVPA